MRYQLRNAENKNGMLENLWSKIQGFLLSENKEPLYIWYRIILFLQKYGFVRSRAGSNFVSGGMCRKLRLYAITYIDEQALRHVTKSQALSCLHIKKTFKAGI